MAKVDIKAKVEKGWIHVIMLFEIVGNPKEHVESTLKSYMQNIKTDSSIEIIEENYGDAEEISNGMFNAFVEADMIVKNLEKLTWLCYNFTPASIEVIEPTTFQIKASGLQNWINDLLAKLHEVGMVSKQISSHNKLLIKNMNRLIKNSILMCVDVGIETPKEIGEKIGVGYKELEPFFTALMRENKLVLDKKQYQRTKTTKKKKKKK